MLNLGIPACFALTLLSGSLWADCEQDYRALNAGQEITHTKENKSFRKVASKMADELGGTGPFRRVEYLQYEVDGAVRHGARITDLDDQDLGQANAWVYHFVAHERTQQPVLIAIEEHPHCCAPFMIEWVCQNPRN